MQLAIEYHPVLTRLSFHVQIVLDDAGRVTLVIVERPIVNHVRVSL